MTPNRRTIAKCDTQEGEKRKGHFDNTRCRIIAKQDTSGGGGRGAAAYGGGQTAASIAR